MTAYVPRNAGHT